MSNDLYNKVTGNTPVTTAIPQLGINDEEIRSNFYGEVSPPSPVIGQEWRDQKGGKFWWDGEKWKSSSLGGIRITDTYGNDEISVANNQGSESILIGSGGYIKAGGGRNIVIGYAGYTSEKSFNSICIGTFAKSYSPRSVVIGDNAAVWVDKGMAIGNNAYVGEQDILVANERVLSLGRTPLTHPQEYLQLYTRITAVADGIKPYDAVTKKQLDNVYNELFTSVSDGKTKVAEAITDKGVPTSTTESFEKMSSNIREITTYKTITKSKKYPVCFLSNSSSNTSVFSTLSPKHTLLNNNKVMYALCGYQNSYSPTEMLFFSGSKIYWLAYAGGTGLYTDKVTPFTGIGNAVPIKFYNSDFLAASNSINFLFYEGWSTPNTTTNLTAVRVGNGTTIQISTPLTITDYIKYYPNDFDPFNYSSTITATYSNIIPLVLEKRATKINGVPNDTYINLYKIHHTGTSSAFSNIYTFKLKECLSSNKESIQAVIPHKTRPLGVSLPNITNGYYIMYSIVANEKGLNFTCHAIERLASSFPSTSITVCSFDYESYDLSFNKLLEEDCESFGIASCGGVLWGTRPPGAFNYQDFACMVLVKNKLYFFGISMTGEPLLYKWFQLPKDIDFRGTKGEVFKILEKNNFVESYNKEMTFLVKDYNSNHYTFTFSFTNVTELECLIHVIPNGFFDKVDINSMNVALNTFTPCLGASSPAIFNASSSQNKKRSMFLHNTNDTLNQAILTLKDDNIFYELPELKNEGETSLVVGDTLYSSFLPIIKSEIYKAASPTSIKTFECVFPDSLSKARQLDTFYDPANLLYNFTSNNVYRKTAASSGSGITIKNNSIAIPFREGASYNLTQFFNIHPDFITTSGGKLNINMAEVVTTGGFEGYELNEYTSTSGIPPENENKPLVDWLAEYFYFKLGIYDKDFNNLKVIDEPFLYPGTLINELYTITFNVYNIPKGAVYFGLNIITSKSLTNIPQSIFTSENAIGMFVSGSLTSYSSQII